MKLYGSWKVTIPGEEYDWEPDLMTGPECYAVELELAGTPWETFDDWCAGIGEARWVPCQALIWFLRRKNGVDGERRDVEFPLRQLQLVSVPKDGAGSEPSDGNGSPPSPDSESAPDISTN